MSASHTTVAMAYDVGKLAAISRTLGSAGGGFDTDRLPAVGVRPGCHCVPPTAEPSGLSHMRRGGSAQTLAVGRGGGKRGERDVESDA